MKYEVYFNIPKNATIEEVEEHRRIMKNAYPEFKPFKFEAENIKEARKKIDEVLGHDLAFELKGELSIHNYSTNKDYDY